MTILHVIKHCPVNLLRNFWWDELPEPVMIRYRHWWRTRAENATWTTCQAKLKELLLEYEDDNLSCNTTSETS